jgi:AbrB family looped-hinge helix DNA binding protein
MVRIPYQYCLILSQEIVKVTSKGQLTIPARIRSESHMSKGSHIYMRSIGDFVIMKKVDNFKLDDISRILEQVAKDKGLTKSLLSQDIDKVREELWKEQHAKKTSKGTPGH